VQEVSGLRPISVTSLAYRTWAWIKMDRMREYIVDMHHPSQYGGVPGRATTDMHLQMQLEMERIMSGVQPLASEPAWRPFGFTEDAWKFFDTLRPKRIAQVLLTEGFPEEDVRLWLAFYKQHKRRFRLSKAVDTRCIEPERGLLQGCSWSLLAGNLLMKRWCEIVEATGALPKTFVDDREV